MNKSEKFIHQANNVHSNKYNYSQIDYKNARTKVELVCSEHGSFFVTPDNHIRLKTGCPTCKGGVKLTTQSFIDKANIIHQNKYTYTDCNYVNNRTPVIITCPIHGIFIQKPADHINGCGCPDCGLLNIKKSKLDNNESFINKAVLKHGSKYDYSDVVYINTNTKIKIICKDHGPFEQRPNDHVKGIGCPNCKLSKGEEKIKNFLDNNSIIYTQQKRFPECRYKKPLPFDFFLIKQNICIEYDGKQHFIPNTIYSKNYEEMMLKDKIKNEFCSQPGSPKLIRISYIDYENIEKIIEDGI